MTAEAKAWVVDLACRKAKELGYPHELWTTIDCLPAMRVSMGRRRATPAFAKLAFRAQAVPKILNEQEIKPHKVRYYLERRDPEFKQKMAEVLCVYREVRLIKETAAAAKQEPSDAVAIVSYDEKPGIQAIATTAPDLPPEPRQTRDLGARPRVQAPRHGQLRWPASTICSPAKATPSSRTATAAANLSNSSSFSMPPIRPTQRSN